MCVFFYRLYIRNEAEVWNRLLIYWQSKALCTLKNFPFICGRCHDWAVLLEPQYDLHNVARPRNA